jgi:large subunit ribosomal protein L3
MKFNLGTKQNMTQVHDESGIILPVTVVKVGPSVVTQVKNVGRDGYAAVQVAFGSQKESRLTKAELGHLKGKGAFKHMREFRVHGDEITYTEGDTISCDTFSVGDVVEVSATSKGKGFAGVVKRHSFAGGPRSHGQKHSEREAGSIGGSGGRAGGRVAKGIRMAGRMGGDRVTVTGLKVVAVDAEKGEVYLTGAIPGVRGALVEIRTK